MPLPPHLQTDLSRFAFTGDEWLISYAHLSASFVTTYPTTFSMAMVLELYLKAYACFLADGGIDATKFGHNIRELYKSLIRDDPEFPKNIHLNPDLSKFPIHELDRDNWRSTWFIALSNEDQLAIQTHYEIYLLMAYAADLKYGISPALPKYSGRIITSSWTRLNPWISDFVVAVRRRIGHPKIQQDDRLCYAVRHPELHPHALPFLQKIHDKTFAFPE